MGINGVVKPTVRKSFEFILKDGQKVELEQDEAEEIRDFLNLELPKFNGISTTSYLRGNEIASVSKPIGVTSLPRRPIPTGYVLMAKRKSEPRNRSPPFTYAYYADAAGNFGYQIEDGKLTSFIRLGKVMDPMSTIGRFVRKIPMHRYMSKTMMQKTKKFSNTQTMKALLDILEMIKMIQREPVYDGRVRSAYRRTIKLDDDVKREREPEGGNIAGALQPQQIPSGSKGA